MDKTQLTRDAVIAGGFIALGCFAPGANILESGFEQHISGLAIGIGLGYLIRAYARPVTKEVKPSQPE